MSYKAPVDDMLFLLERVFDVSRIKAEETYSHLDSNTISSILFEAAKLSEKVLSPLNALSDKQPPKLVDGQVICTPGFKEGYEAIANGGWVGMSGKTEYGGMELPNVIRSCINEILGSGCLSLSLNPLMTQGQIEALENHASKELKNLYLPNLISGKWSGTMNLTEEHAGSDVGALKTSAIAENDGTYSITGRKIFISWGDHDLTENICHLVLARLPDSLPGTKGISLFLVPKYLLDKKGRPEKKNNMQIISIEQKMGLHGSPTAVIDYEAAKGWMVGEPNKGMSAMFTMMNNARLGVALEGVSQAELSLQLALNYARNRRQGNTLIKEGNGNIIDHADVRRNLIVMKSLTFVARAICLDTAISADLSKNFGLKELGARAAFLTPIAKAFCTNIGCRVSDLGIQIHGGLGYIEASGAAQLYRDVRITAIYEGTNGIQAIDLVNRKLSDDGKAAIALIRDLEVSEQKIEQKSLLDAERIKYIRAARRNLIDALNWMIANQNINDRYAGASQFLMAFGFLLGCNYYLKSLIADPSSERTEMTIFYLDNILPEMFSATRSACCGASTLYSVRL